MATGPGGTLESAYSPPLLLDGAYTSAASQTISARARSGIGFSAGLNLFPFDHFGLLDRLGLQLLFDRVTADVSGANGSYSVALDYVSRPPPDNNPQPVSIRHTTTWPDSSGSLTQTSIGVNAIVRFGDAGRFNGAVSAGPMLWRVTGDIQPLAFTSFTLGGHSVLFEDDYRLGAVLGPATAFGVNVGAEVSAALTPAVAVVAGYRYFAGPDVDVAVQPSAVLNPAEVGSQQLLSDIERSLQLRPMKVSPGGSRLFVGMKIRR